MTNTVCALVVVVLVFFTSTYAAQSKENDSQTIQKIIPSAEQGDAKAQCDLGYMLLIGDGIKKDREEGIKWLREAAAQGNAKTQEHLQENGL